MTDKKGRRRFGNLRQLPSDRWQVRYRGPDGRLRSLPRTFEAKRDAEHTLSVIETQLVQDDWTDPKRGTVKLAGYAERWIAERPGLWPSTAQLYRRLLVNYVVPHLGEVPLNKIITALVREWRAMAAPGASLRDLMMRMGHDNPRAAMIYQHATTVEDRVIANRLSGLVERAAS